MTYAQFRNAYIARTVAQYNHVKFKYGDDSQFNGQERNKLNQYGRYKGEIYKYRPENLFVQSSKFQAIEIVQISGKEVFCTENMKLYKP